MKRIGIFGGTFDPIHSAHISVALAAQKQLGLDFVLMMTSGNPPHKTDKAVLDAKIRHIMVKKAAAEYDRLIPFDFELKKKEPCYSFETLATLKSEYPEDELYFIIGGDSLRDFHTWRHPEKICEMCTLCVYFRGEALDIESINTKMGAKIEVIDGDFFDISSSEIRSDLSMASHCQKSVADFIEKYGLYRSVPSPEEYIKQILPEARFRHSMGVASLARRLGKAYGENPDELYLAGILHDIAKPVPYSDALKMCDELEAEVDEIERGMPPLLHAKLGAELVKCRFGIKEGKITSAIRRHTVGAPKMSLFDKIIFVADMCEENRSFDGAAKIRGTAFENIDRACVMCIEASERFNRAKNNPLHPLSAEIKAELMQNLQAKGI